METKAVDNAIMNLTEIIASLNPTWIQELVMGIYINDIRETHYQEGENR